jgi:hypothetical protein
VTRRGRSALRQAIEVADEEPGRAAQLHRMLADGRPWDEVAGFAAGCAQFRNLNLRPWECVPCSLAADDIAAVLVRPDDHRRQHGAALLLRRMLAAGISRWHPDPMCALAKVEVTAR